MRLAPEVLDLERPEIGVAGVVPGPALRAVAPNLEGVAILDRGNGRELEFHDAAGERFDLDLLSRVVAGQKFHLARREVVIGLQQRGVRELAVSLAAYAGHRAGDPRRPSSETAREALLDIRTGADSPRPEPRAARCRIQLNNRLLPKLLRQGAQFQYGQPAELDLDLADCADRDDL